MNGIFYSIISFLLEKFGLISTIHIKDIVMLSSSFVAGLISMILLYSLAATRVRVKECLGDTVAVSMTHPETKKSLIFIGANNWTISFKDSVSVNVAILLMRYTRIRTITVRDVKVVRIGFITIILCAVVSLSFALYLASHPIVESHKEEIIHIRDDVYDHEHDVHHENK